MPFDPTYRYLAFDASVLQAVGNLRDTYGDMASTAPDHEGELVKTLVCGLDNADTGKLRAGILGETIAPIRLSDGRFCVGGYWSEAVIEAFESGAIPGEELTESQVKALQPTTEF